MNNNLKASIYAQKVELLLRLIPIVMEEEVFAIHGGTAINLFLMDLPRFSVDIDLTYIPLNNRQESLEDINSHLRSIADKATKTFKGMHVIPNFASSKLLCEYHGRQVKIEVNQTKRGIVGGEIVTLPLSNNAQQFFSMYCEANVVPLTQLYGGKIAAALSRQHPRDLFDIKHMTFPLRDCREGLIFSLLGSDRPIYESLAPNLIDQREAMENQFAGMTDIPFSYTDFEQTRSNLINEIITILTQEDINFLLSFEASTPEWNGYEFEYFKNYPSVLWKLQNLKKLAKHNSKKLLDLSQMLKDLLSDARI